MIQSPGGRFEDQIRFLRTLEALDSDHIRVLRAILAEPTDAPSYLGSFRQTLIRRFPGSSQEQIIQLVTDLDGLLLTNRIADRLVVRMTGRDSADMRHTLSDYGRQFVRFLRME